MIDPFRIFHVRVSRLVRLSPSFLRVTFTGDDLDLFADNGHARTAPSDVRVAGR